MAHLEFPEGQTGIMGPVMRFPKTGEMLRQIKDELIKGDSILSVGERELIALYVSARNECVYCSNSHGGTAERLLEIDRDRVATILADPESAPIGELMKALLAIAGKVQIGGRRVTKDEIARARAAGADDKAIHDTVLIAAMFCAFNRYVDGLDTDIPAEDCYGVLARDF
jgi:uncharacterized peroxidase-related enzyme